MEIQLYFKYLQIIRLTSFYSIFNQAIPSSSVVEYFYSSSNTCPVWIKQPSASFSLFQLVFFIKKLCMVFGQHMIKRVLR